MDLIPEHIRFRYNIHRNINLSLPFSLKKKKKTYVANIYFY